MKDTDTFSHSRRNKNLLSLLLRGGDEVPGNLCPTPIISPFCASVQRDILQGEGERILERLSLQGTSL